MAAAIRCVERHGIDRTSVALIATEAGVSRPTLYAYFENRDQIVNQAVRAASESFVERVVAHARQFDTAADRLVEAMLFAVRGIRAEPALAMRFGAGQLLHGPLTPEELHFARLCLGPVVELAPELGRWLDGAAELAARLTISLLSRDPLEPRSEDEERAFLRHWWPRALGLPDEGPRAGRARRTRAATSRP
jgi:AcrR family transcriptional regulator